MIGSEGEPRRVGVWLAWLTRRLNAGHLRAPKRAWRGRAAGLEPSHLGFSSLQERETALGGLLGRVSAFEPIATLHGMPTLLGVHRPAPARIGRVESEPSCSADQDGEPPGRKIVGPTGPETSQQLLSPRADGGRQIREVIPSIPSLIFLEGIDAHGEIVSRPRARPSRVWPVCMSLAPPATKKPHTMIAKVTSRTGVDG